MPSVRTDSIPAVRSGPAAGAGDGPASPATGQVGGPRPGRVASDRAGTVGRDLVDLLLPWVLGLATFVARLATAATGPTDWDSAQYAAAVSRFDVTHGRPQPPGYLLYVLSGRLVHGLGIETVRALVVVAAAASALAVGLVVVAGRDLGGRWVGVAAGLLVATSPFAWFNGSIVATYSFDLVAAPLLVILAWRARPHSWHGAAAFASLGLLAGFRQSILQSFALLALLAVAGSVRRVREAVVVVAAGLAAVAAWMVPMAVLQPGGLATWIRATRSETLGAFRVTSVLDHAASGSTNLGTFAAYTTVALLPLAALALVSLVLLAIRGLVRSTRDGPHASAPDTTGADWRRPWYQSRTAILVAAIVPPAALVALVQFAKGGYLLAYLPGAVIALLLAPAALLHAGPAAGRGTGRHSDQPDEPAPRPGDAPVADRSGAGRALTRTWTVLATLAVLATAWLGAERFLGGVGVLPATASAADRGVWITQARYQAPYLDTRSAIRSADTIDRALAQVAPLVHPGRDVVVIDTVDGGSTFYRNAGWELPLHRVALISPGTTLYNEQFGSLYYTSGTIVPVGVGGSVYLIAPPSLPGLAKLAGAVQAFRVPGSRPVADYLVWRLAPGADILGIRVVVRPGPRPLGSPIVG